MWGSPPHRAWKPDDLHIKSQSSSFWAWLITVLDAFESISKGNFVSCRRGVPGWMILSIITTGNRAELSGTSKRALLLGVTTPRPISMGVKGGAVPPWKGTTPTHRLPSRPLPWWLVYVKVAHAAVVTSDQPCQEIGSPGKAAHKGWPVAKCHKTHTCVPPPPANQVMGFKL